MSGERDWQVFPVASYPGDLWGNWQRLADEHHESNPMLGSVFAGLLVEYFGRDVYVACYFADERPQAMALLEKNANGVWEGFMPGQAQVSLLVINPQLALNVDGLCRRLPGFCPRIDLFSLDPDEHPGVVKGLRSAQKAADNMRVERQKDFAFYWQARSKNLQRNLVRYKKKLADDGLAETCRVVLKLDEVADAVERYAILESAGWKGRQGSALHPSNKQGAFYKELLLTMAESGNALVFEMYVENVLVASTLSISNAHEIIILKSTFDENQKKYSFGRLILHHYIEYVFEQTKIGSIECYTNANKELLSWATHERPMFNASIYSSSPAASLLRSALAVRDRLKKNTH